MATRELSRRAVQTQAAFMHGEMFRASDKNACDLDTEEKPFHHQKN